jgi:hypothetical protein
MVTVWRTLTAPLICNVPSHWDGDCVARFERNSLGFAVHVGNVMAAVASEEFFDNPIDPGS